jgi:hypothetical protein
MNPLTEIWFWLLIISIIGFIIAFILFETYNQVVDGKIVIPGWIWVIYFVSIAILVMAFVIFCYRMYRHYQHLEMLEACYGVVPAPPIKKSVTCPVQCDTPCETTTEPVMILQPVEFPVKVESVVNPVRGDIVVTARGQTARVY